MHRALVSVAVGLAGIGAVAGAGWVLQRAALPPPKRSDRVAADAASWLLRYRVLEDTFHVDGRTASGVCLHGWFPRPDGKLVPGSLLAFRPGPRLLALGGEIRLLDGSPPPEIPPRVAVALGCTSALGKEVAAAAQLDPHLRVERGYAAGMPALALRLPVIDRERLTLVVAARDFRPLAASVSVDGRAGSARIRLVKATPALLSGLIAGQGERQGDRA